MPTGAVVSVCRSSETIGAATDDLYGDFPLKTAKESVVFVGRPAAWRLAVFDTSEPLRGLKRCGFVSTSIVITSSACIKQRAWHVRHSVLAPSSARS